MLAYLANEAGGGFRCELRPMPSPRKACGTKTNTGLIVHSATAMSLFPPTVNPSAFGSHLGAALPNCGQFPIRLESPAARSHPRTRYTRFTGCPIAAAFSLVEFSQERLAPICTSPISPPEKLCRLQRQLRMRYSRRFLPMQNTSRLRFPNTISICSRQPCLILRSSPCWHLHSTS